MTENDRLTSKTELGISIDKNEDCPTTSICWDCDIPPRRCNYISDAIEKLAKYEDVGTVEEFKALKEKAEPKKPVLRSGVGRMHINKGNKPHEWKVTEWQDWCCPVCGWFVGERFNRYRNSGELHPHDQRKSDYCNECGQAIYWEKKRR